jgi:integrase
MPETTQGAPKPRKARDAFGSVVDVWSKPGPDGRKRWLSYGVRYTQGGRRCFKGGFPDKRSAEAFRSSRQSEAVAAVLVNKPLGTPSTVRELCARYRAHLAAHAAPRTGKAARSPLARLEREFGERIADDVEPAAWVRFADALATDLIPSTSNVYRARCAALFAWAMKLKLARSNPIEEFVARRRQSVKVVPFLSRADVHRVYAALANEEHRRAATFLGEKGLRLREAADATWDEFTSDFSVWTLAADRAKMGSGRKLLVPELARRALVAQMRAQGFASKPADGRVFTFETTWFGWEVHRAAERAGFTNVSPHTLRHAFASHLASIGVEPVAIQRVLGHASLKTTLHYMRHASSDAAERAMRQFEASTPAPTKGAPLRVVASA